MTTPDPQDVEQLTALLDLMHDFPSNEQRARYLLSSNWMINRGAAAAAQAAEDLAAARERTRKATAAAHYAHQAALAAVTS